MKTLRQLDHLLAEAAQCLDDSAQAVREIPDIETKAGLIRIGTAMNSIWELREIVHKISPELRPAFVEEHETDVARYEELEAMAGVAYKLEHSGEIVAAIASFEALRNKARFGYFQMVAEAGLFRLSVSGVGSN